MTDYFDTFQRKYHNWQQQREEIEAVAKLIGECNSYLEIGTAEGGSLYFFAHKMGFKRAVCVDLDEAHTRPYREWVFEQLSGAVEMTLYSGNSMDAAIIEQAAKEQFDVVFIDGGHDYATVKSDWVNYGKLANKYVVFHDICLPDVKKLWDELPGIKLSLIGDGRFGMGILTV